MLKGSNAKMQRTAASIEKNIAFFIKPTPDLHHLL